MGKFCGLSVSFLLLVVSINVVELAFLHPALKICRRSQPDLDACVTEHGKVALPQIAYTGIPEYGMKPLDPLDLGSVDVLKSPSLRIKLTDTKVYGMGAAQLALIRTDPIKQHVTMAFTLVLTIKGKYIMDGQILLIPLKGNGNLEIKVDKTSCTYEYDYIVRKNKKDGIGYPHIADDKLKCKMGKMLFNLENLFGQNKELGQTVNEFLSQNSGLIEKEVSGPILKLMQEKTKREVNAIYHSIPYDVILPE